MTPGTLLLVAAMGMLAGLLSAYRTPRLWLAATLIASLSALAAAAWILGAGGEWAWRSDILIGGQSVQLRLDGVSAFFLALLSVLGGVTSVYALEYWSDSAHPRSAPAGRAWWNLLLTSMGWVLLSANALLFLIGWELFTVSAFFLITLDRQRREVRAAGWLYFTASHVGTLLLFAFFSALAAANGNWELGPMRGHAELAPLFWLALFGFGIKAGIFPMHIWLPSAHANAPSHVSAIMSGMAIKMGIYGLVRFSGWLPVPENAAWTLVALGLASAVLGVAFALGQHDLKRLLAYHSVENIGIILIGLGFSLVATAHGHATWGRLALAGGLLHVWNHGLFKGLLFLGAGSVLHATRTREMSRLGGLWRLMPWTAGCFTLGAAAIAGLPPLNGFVSEWLVYLGLFDAVAARGLTVWSAAAAVILLAITGALALACFVKVCGVVFLGLPRTKQAEHAHESGWLMRVPMLVLAGACVSIGLAPVFFWPAVAHAAMAWNPDWTLFEPPSTLATLGTCNVVLVLLAALAVLVLRWRVRRNGLRRALTWDCAYASPTPRMQYTAGSFAGIITGWFAWILQPERHEHVVSGPFPRSASLAEHTPETVLEKVITPLSKVVMLVSTTVRRLQHGRLQFYILYLVVGVAALAVLVFWGGGQ